MYRHLTQEQLEREYNPSSNIPHIASLHARRKELAQNAQKILAGAYDIPYGTGPLETYDLFFAGRGQAPIQIFFHGGSWKGQDKSNYSFLALPLTAHNVISINVNYDLCPHVTIEALIDECRHAVLHVWKHARLMGGDPNRISVCGHSAGAHIATRMIETEWTHYHAPADLIKAGVLISGLYDLEPIRLTATNKDVRLTPEDVQRESPMTRIPTRKIPLFLACGTDDNAEFCRQTRDYAHHLRAHDVPITYVEAQGHNHFTILEALGDANDTLGRAMVDMALGHQPTQPI
jgi:arylformamidase